MTRLTGVGAAPGIAVGPIWRHVEHAPAEGAARDAPAADLDALADRAAADLERLAEDLRAAGRHDEAAIFDAQAMMATDPALLADCTRRIAAGTPIAVAIREAAGAAAATLAALDDEVLAARAADVRDVGARIARLVTGTTLALPEQPSIAVADDLPPSVTAEVPAGRLLGIALAGGSRTAHAAILARSMGIPAVVGVAGLLDRLADEPAHSAVAIDGDRGIVVLDPTPADLAELRRAAADATARSERGAALRSAPAQLADGERVHLLANWASERDTARALEMGAEGIGLYRTEFLFMGRGAPPTEEEQVAAYRAAFEAFGPDRHVVIRLLDVGGDKQLPYLRLAREDNPFLGVRALRLATQHRPLLVGQLRAISMAGALAGVSPHVMAPMVATLADVDLLRALRDEAQASLAAEGRPRAERIVTGIMVEVPAASILAVELAREVDFFSIGTNDLTQYVMAADRTNAALGALQDALHPAVLRAVAMTIAGADARGIPVAVCGELAGDPAGALVLVGLGVDELSADAGSLDALRMHLRAVARAELDRLASAALGARDAAAVRALAAPLLARVG